MPDYARLLATLLGSKTQKDNNALFQAVAELIRGATSLQDRITALEANAEGLDTNNSVPVPTAVSIIEIDTSSSPQSYDPSGITDFVVVKDISGNASVNNITITATVDGTVNPVINTDYRGFRIYQNSTGFFTW